MSPHCDTCAHARTTLSDDDDVFVVVEFAPDGVSVCGAYANEADADDCARGVRSYYDNEHSKAHLFRWQVMRTSLSL